MMQGNEELRISDFRIPVPKELAAGGALDIGEQGGGKCKQSLQTGRRSES